MTFFVTVAGRGTTTFGYMFLSYWTGTVGIPVCISRVRIAPLQCTRGRTPRPALAAASDSGIVDPLSFLDHAFEPESLRRRASCPHRAGRSAAGGELRGGVGRLLNRDRDRSFELAER